MRLKVVQVVCFTAAGLGMIGLFSSVSYGVASSNETQQTTNLIVLLVSVAMIVTAILAASWLAQHDVRPPTVIKK